MKHILVATDFSERSDRALRRATLLARESGASLTIVHGVDNDRPPRIVDQDKREAEILMRELVSTLRTVDGVDGAAKVVLGEPSQAILQASEEARPDLLVIGPHRRQIFRDIFVGTTAERTIRAARCPVLMANAAPVGPYRHILLTTDLSDISRDAVASFRKLQMARRTRHSVLHVFDAPAMRVVHAHELPGDAKRHYIEDQRTAAAVELNQFLMATETTEAVPYLRYAANNANYEILGGAAEAGADLIVLGKHHKNAVERVILGSITERVLRDAPIDALVIPPLGN
jgi:nucleotide-binding universal stress UspA family protein